MATVKMGAVLTGSVICILVLMVEVSNGGCPFAAMHKPRKSSRLSCNGLSNITCNATSKYRSYDGSCNNLLHPEWGANDTRYQRLLPARYGDGISSPRVAKSGNNLPNAREFTLKVYTDVSVNSTTVAHYAMTFGQFISHDMSNAKNISKTASVDCCSAGTESKKRCYPMKVPDNDPEYTPHNITCLNFTRTLTDKDLNCSGKWDIAEQISEVNAYLDLSLVYGNDNETNAELRSFSNGLLVFEERNDQHWMPPYPDPSDVCKLTNDNDTCYQAGDVRVNQNPPLTSQHLLFFREHNRIATKLAEINPHWDDETLFQESKKINAAQFQSIVYNHWLPLILGNDTVKRRNLTYFGATDFVNDYNETVNAGVLAEHAQAAYRFFHTNVQGWLDMDIENRTTVSSARLSDWLFNPTILELGNSADDLIRGLCTEPQSESDRYLTKEITWFLAKSKNNSWGQDLRAIDVQRDRDHALPSHNDLLEYLGLPRATTFDNFTDRMSLENVALLQSIYECPDDVDLTVGGSLETVTTGLTGPTYLEILAEQFWRTRVGDRFFYENCGITGFTIGQLNQIRNVTMARIICDNAHNITKIQPDVFRMISGNNSLTSCDSIPEVDLSYWKDTVSTTSS